MGSATAMNQLLRNLCHHSMWKYAILWKFQDEDHILLTCEYSYAIDTKSSITMEYVQDKEFITNHPWITSFGCESIGQNGSSPSYSIAVAVSNMARFSYVLGEGIVGKVATMVRHQWICVGEMNPELLFEYPDELGLQVAAGIKTILLLPLLSLGLVQLGSLDKLSEDLTMVAQLKDLFYSYRYNLDSNSTFELRIGQIDSHMALNRPLEKYSTCLEINTSLTYPIQTQPFPMPDLAILSFDQVASVRLPHHVFQSNDPFTQVGFQQDHGLSANLLNEIRGNAIYCDIFQDHSDGQVMINSCTLTERTVENDESPTPNEMGFKSIPVINQELTSKNSTIFDTNMKNLLQHNFCDFNKANIKFTEQFDAAIDSTTDGRNLDLSVESDLLNVMEQNRLMGCNNSTCIENQSKANEGSESISSFKAEMPETIRYSLGEPCVMEENLLEYLARIAMEELRCVSDGNELKSCECAKFICSSSGRCSNSCSTQCKTQGASNSEDCGRASHKMSLLISDFEGFTSHLTCPQKNFVHMPLKNEDHEKSIFGFWRSCLKESHSSNRQIKNRGSIRQRPRDRQLIQDRIRELRELIPNSSKCSIDALLEQAVRHMMFLQSVPIHAHKLSQTTRSKIGDKDSIFYGTELPENQANRRSEVGTKLMPFPLVVENLERPDQMLVEMQCRNPGLFLDIAQAIKRLGLTILKAILESRLEELWAHFIVEIPKGFHRMDIVWPLMQLLQLKF